MGKRLIIRKLPAAVLTARRSWWMFIFVMTFEFADAIKRPVAAFTSQFTHSYSSNDLKSPFWGSSPSSGVTQIFLKISSGFSR
jgi:hypothetical protein